MAFKVTEFKITPKGEVFDRPEEMVRQSINMAAEELASFGENLIKKKAPIGVTRTLVGDINAEVVNFPRKRILYGVSVVHGPVMELGRGRGKRMPPSAALIPWVIRKLNVDARQAPSVAFAVARSISKKGIVGRGFFKKSISPIRKFALQAFDLHVGRAVKRINE